MERIEVPAVTDHTKGDNFEYIDLREYAIASSVLGIEIPDKLLIREEFREGYRALQECAKKCRGCAVVGQPSTGE